MATTAGTGKQLQWWKYWPAVAGGASGVWFTVFLSRWMPRHFAAAFAWLVTWFIVGLVLGRYFPPRWGLPVWVGALITAIGAGLTAGLMSYLLQWP